MSRWAEILMEPWPPKVRGKRSGRIALAKESERGRLGKLGPWEPREERIPEGQSRWDEAERLQAGAADRRA